MTSVKIEHSVLSPAYHHQNRLVVFITSMDLFNCAICREIDRLSYWCVLRRVAGWVYGGCWDDDITIVMKWIIPENSLLQPMESQSSWAQDASIHERRRRKKIRDPTIFSFSFTSLKTCVKITDNNSKCSYIALHHMYITVYLYVCMYTVIMTTISINIYAQRMIGQLELKPAR